MQWPAATLRQPPAAPSPLERCPPPWRPHAAAAPPYRERGASDGLLALVPGNLVPVVHPLEHDGPVTPALI